MQFDHQWTRIELPNLSRQQHRRLLLVGIANDFSERNYVSAE